MTFNIKNNLFALLMIPATMVLVNCKNPELEENSEKKAQDRAELENDMERYNLNSLMDFTYESDGSLILYLAPELPKDAPKSNWLPSPNDKNFSLTLRMYIPKKEVLDGSYYVPPIQNTSTK